MVEQDRREQILAAIKTALEGIAGVTVLRNVFTVAETQRPAFVVLDGDEEVIDSGDNKRGRDGAGQGPYIIRMDPSIWLLSAGDSDTIGSAINSLRLKAISALTQDESLKTLCLDGAIRYTGLTSGLEAGRSAEVEARLTFEFEYVLHPNAI